MKFNGNAMTISGIQKDTIARIGEPYKWSTHASHNTIEMWHIMYMQHGGKDEGALARTLCRGVSGFVFSEEALADVTPLEAGEAEGRLEKALNLCKDRDDVSDTVARSVDPMIDMICDSRFFVTQGGLGPTSTRAGDVVVLALGANLPLLLRPTDREGSRLWSFVGELYLDGITHGEAAEGLSEHDLKQITIQ